MLEQEFGKEVPLTICCGKIHDYLGMTLDFSIAGKVQIRMEDYITNMLMELPADMEGITTTPATEHLFKINETPTYLDKNEAMFFHHNEAKLLFLCKPTCPDMQTVVAFLSTCVQHPDHDDYKKLA